jgi:hypothetical protein
MDTDIPVVLTSISINLFFPFMMCVLNTFVFRCFILIVLTESTHSTLACICPSDVAAQFNVISMLVCVLAQMESAKICGFVLL